MAPILLSLCGMEVQATTTPHLLRSRDAAPKPPRRMRTPGRPGGPASAAWPWRAWLAIVALPVALLAGLMWRYGVDVPHFDEWIATAPLFAKHAAGTLGVGDFLTPHNEHRIVLPKVLFFLLGWLTHWNTRVEIAGTLLVLIGVSACCWQLLRLTGWRDSLSARAVFCVLAAFLFSTVQRENLLWGFQLSFTISILFFTSACCAALAWPRERGLLAVMLLATAATYSMASGFVCWLLAAPVLWVSARGLGRKWWALYAAGAVLTVALYFVNYERPPHHPSMAKVLETPVQGALYLLAYLGGPFAHGTAFAAPRVAPWMGGALLAALVAALAGVWRARGDAAFLRRAMPWLMIALLGCANAAITMVGRLGFGVPQALESRYSSYALLLPLGLVPLAVLLLGRASAPGRSLGRGLVAAGSGALLLLLWLSQLQLAPDWAVRRRTMLLERALAQMAWCAHEPQLLRRYVTPDVRAFPETVAALDDLGFLRPGLVRDPRIGAIADESDGSYGRLERHQQEGAEWVVAGWAVLPDLVEPAHAVLLTWEQAGQEPVIFGLSALGFDRPELARVSGEPSYAMAGWVYAFPRTKLPAGAGVVKAWAYDAERGRAWPLAGAASIAP